VATGTPELIAQVKGSYTGKYLKPILDKKKPAAVRKRA
jgi:excinuclease ABC subunit A